MAQSMMAMARGLKNRSRSVRMQRYLAACRNQQPDRLLTAKPAEWVESAEKQR